MIEAFGADPARVRVVAPGRAAAARCARRTWRGRWSQPFLPAGAARYILAIGTAEPRKDLPGLVRAFDQLAADHADLALVLAGPPGWGEEALDAAVGRPGPGRGWCGRAGWSPPTLAALLQEAVGAGLPLALRGLRLPPLEAMAAGVPVVATRAGSLPEVLGDGASLVEVGDHDGLAEALDRVLDDAELRERLVAAGRGAGRPSFSWDALRRRAGPALPRRGGRTPVADRTASAEGRSWRSSSCAGPSRAASAPMPAGLLAGLAQCADEGDEVDVTLFASRVPGTASGRPAPTRWPASAGRSLLLAAAGPAADPGLGSRLAARPGGFDVVHSVSLAAPPGRRRGGRAHVVTVHDLAWRRHPEATTARGGQVARGRAAPGPGLRRRRWS